VLDRSTAALLLTVTEGGAWAAATTRSAPRTPRSGT